MTKSERAATAKKKKSAGKQFVANTKAGKVKRKYANR